MMRHLQIFESVETRMGQKILFTMYGTMILDDESADIYYDVQWTNEPYTLQKTSQ